MKHINRNFAWCREYSDASFSGRVHEAGEWHDDEYFLLEEAIYEAAARYGNRGEIPRELSWRIMRIFSLLLVSFSAHYDPNDYFQFSGLSDEQIHMRRERIQLVFEGFFSGEMPAKNTLEY